LLQAPLQPRGALDASKAALEALTARMQNIAKPIFRKTADTFAAGAKTLEREYFVSPEIFAEEPSFAKATARQARV
jgi:hypothetical protein